MHPLIWIPPRPALLPPDECRRAYRGRSGGGTGTNKANNGSPSPWTPAALGALVEARWESDAGITLTSGRVSGWNDLKNAHHWTQGTAGYRPVVEDSVFGASKGIRFTAANTERLLLTSTAMISGLTAAHAFLIFKLAADPTVGNADGMWGFSGGTPTRFPFSGDGNIYDNFATNSRKTAGNPAPSLEAARCYEVTADTNWQSFIDGTAVAAAQANTVAWGTTRQTLGADEGATPVWCLDGWIGALIVCSAKLTGADLTNMRGYLASKYGVTFA